MGTSVSHGRTTIEHAENAADAIDACTRAVQPTLRGSVAVPLRQARWTRLGSTMGYTNTPAKRAAIHTAVVAMVWIDPHQLGDVLGAAPVRFVVGGLFFGRAWQLHAAATTALPASGELTAVGRDGAPADRPAVGHR